MSKEVVKAPNIRVARFLLTGVTPLVQLRFSKKAELMAKMAEGQKSKNRKAKEARDYDAEFRAAQHVSNEGWNGFPAPAIRAACISACRLVGIKMTLAKLSVFVVADGLDAEDATPLVRITEGEPEPCSHTVRNATGVADVRVRAMFKQWKAVASIRYDADQFAASDMQHLLERAGSQVGIGEGRPDSKASAGMGWGTFTVEAAG